MGIMYWGVLYPTLAVLPQMRARRSGRIVNVTSIGARVSVPHLLPYNSAKFAAFGLSQGLRAELAREGITVTTIVPGLRRTGSHLKAYFKGRREWEYTWFALGASMPVISMDAERAAAQIVGAARRGDATRVLSLPAVILDRFQGLLPGTTAEILGLVNWVLPNSGRAGAGMEPGGEVHERMRSPILTALTGWGLSAARKFQR
jgi:NAD(P)-dependent dehydrogenase (short-subunit alcohol dehydrogenase family)